jgi:hypothetical protein
VKHLLFVGTKEGIHTAQRTEDAPQHAGEVWKETGPSLVAHRVNSLGVQGSTVMTLQWRYILPDAGWVRAVATVRVR